MSGFPGDLTFGVFDAAALDQVVPHPVLWLWQVQSKAGKVFASLIDGGSRLSHDNAHNRFLLRSTTTGTTPSANIEPKDQMPHPGDVVRLDEYSFRQIVGKGEIVFLVAKMVILRSCDSLLHQLPRSALQPFPYERAAKDLSSLHQTPPPPGGRDSSAGSFDQQQQQRRGSAPDLPVRPGSSASGSRATPYGSGGPTDAGGATNSLSAAAAAGMFRPTSTTTSGPIARRTDGTFVEIKNLTSFLGRWVVKGRFFNKGEPRTYSNQRGEGKLWTCELMDSADECGTIRCTFFNKAVDKFYPVIRENEIYSVSRGTLRAANRKFNAGAHQFEMQLGEDAEIHWISSDDPSIPSKPIAKVVPIIELANLAKNTSVSVCGICVNMSDVVEIIQRSTGQPKPKREITLCDYSATCVDVTVWDNKIQLLKNVVCPPFNQDSYPLVLLENARVDEFNGRKLSTVSLTDIRVISPQTSPDASRTYRWFTQEGGREALGQLSSLTQAGWGKGRAGGGTERVTVSELRSRATEAPDEELRDKGVWYTLKGTLLSINRDRALFWSACPFCNRKVSAPPGTSDPDSNNFYATGGAADQKNAESNVPLYCTHCGKTVEKPVKKYILTCDVSDTTGTLKCGAMADRGTLIMGGVEADALLEARAKGTGPDVFQRFGDYFLQRLRREYVFKIQAKSEVYRDETRIRYRIFGAEPLTGVMTGAPANGPFGLATARAQLIKESHTSLNFIYEHIPNVTTVPRSPAGLGAAAANGGGGWKYS